MINSSLIIQKSNSWKIQDNGFTIKTPMKCASVCAERNMDTRKSLFCSEQKN